MNNSQLQRQSTAISQSGEVATIATMASGQRSDAWHWRDSDVSQFSSEKLQSILNTPLEADSEQDRQALERVRQELEKRVAALG